MVIEMYTGDNNNPNKNSITTEAQSKANANAVNVKNPIGQAIADILKQILDINYGKLNDNNNTNKVEALDNNHRIIFEFKDSKDYMCAAKTFITPNATYFKESFVYDKDHNAYQGIYESRIHNQHELDANTLAFLERIIAPTICQGEEYLDEKIMPIEIYLSEMVFPNINDDTKALDKENMQLCTNILNNMKNEPGIRKQFHSKYHSGIYEELNGNKAKLIYTIQPRALSKEGFFGLFENKTNENNDFLNNLYFYNEYENEVNDKSAIIKITCKIFYAKNNKFIEVANKQHTYTFHRRFDGGLAKMTTQLSEYLEMNRISN